MSESDRPFRILGWHLKLAREQLNESVAEVSGATEIETDFLEKIEDGKARPSEDVLVLLINHLGLEDAEANSLWELAGYVSDKSDSETADNSNNNLDIRIIYTDLAHVTVNDFGVVMNFLQAGNLSNQSLLVSRVGMSQEQARHLLKILQQSLDKTDTKAPRVLPPATRRTKTSDSDQS